MTTSEVVVVLLAQVWAEVERLLPQVKFTFHLLYLSVRSEIDRLRP